MQKHVTGNGNFIDDIHFPQMLRCAFVRSVYPHAKIDGVDFSSINDHAVTITWRELERYAKPLKLTYPFKQCNQMTLSFLARDKVRYVGEPIAAVIARDQYLASDFADEVDVNYIPLPSITDACEAANSNTFLYDAWGSNLMVRFCKSFGDVDNALNKSDLAIDERFDLHRQAAVPLEPRGCIAHYDRGRNFLTVWTSNQNPHLHRSILSEVLSIPEGRIRVIVPDVGGGFGQKSHTYPEDVVVAVASIITGKPVKWVETRRENLISSAHSREQTHFIKVGAKKDGTITALKDIVYLDLGANLLYPHDYLELAQVVMDILPGPYRLQNYSVEVSCLVTNKSPSGAYRGFGHPEATFVRERVIDLLADELGLTPAELRLRNLISSKDIPYTSPTGMLFDSGDPKQAFTRLVTLIQADHLHNMATFNSTKVVGVGVAVGDKGSVPTMMGVTQKWGSSEAAAVKMTQDGRVVVCSGAVSMGTHLETVLAKIVADILGTDIDDVEVVLGDTQVTSFSTGLWGSRGAVMCGGAAALAAEKLKEKILTIASHLLECNIKDLEMGRGKVFVKDYPEKYVSFAEIARKAYNEPYLFPQIDTTLETVAVYDPPNISRKPDELGRMNAVAAVSTAAVAAFAEVDIETCEVRLLKVFFVEDGGRYINPIDVDNQLVGGIAQAIGGALYESVFYSENGVPQTTTLADYLVPSSVEIPVIEIEHITSPSPFTFMGLKGVGETGTVPVMAAVASAVQDALRKANVKTVIRKSSIFPSYIWKIKQGT